MGQRGRIRMGIALALALARPAPAAETQPKPTPAEPTLAEAAAIADTTTAANADPAYRALLGAEYASLLRVLRGSPRPLPDATVGKARQSAAAARVLWAGAAGYDFAVAANQAADIALLSSYGGLSAAVLARNAATVAAINHGAAAAQQRHALFDADGVATVLFLAEALGPRLGAAFLRADERGDLARATALIKASEIGVGKAKAAYAVPRPYAVPGNTIQLVADDAVAGDGARYKADGNAFPSGHTNVGYTAALLLAAMLPERFLPLVARAAGFGYSRAVLGVHYPLDVIGGRMVAERNVAHFLADPGYRALFDDARDALRATLARECGTPVPACAAPDTPAADPWAAPAQRRFHAFTMDYGLPRTGPADAPAEVPEGAEVLLETLRPDLPAAERRRLLADTAAPAGAPLDGGIGSWQRVDLYEAGRAALAR